MANRRGFQTLTRYLQSVRTLAPFSQTVSPALAQCLSHISPSNQSFDVFRNNVNVYSQSALFSRHFCSRRTDNENDGEDEDEDDDDDDDEGDEDYESDGDGEEVRDEDESANLSAEDKEKEAAEIGYRVVGPLQPSERVLKPYEPVFAVVQIGSHQFKVSNGDAIFTEKLKFCNVNDKLILNKVLLLGSKTQTIIGRPILPDAAVHALVEEHALDAKVIVFKKKRRKNYRRTKGHRQMLTKLRITNIEGIEKPKKTTASKAERKDKVEKKVAVEA